MGPAPLGGSVKEGVSTQAGPCFMKLPCLLGGPLGQIGSWRCLDSAHEACVHAGLLAIRAERDQP